ncbi:MAG: ABC transporter permease [Dysgonamonadaceae bacterium]|nr:ABC transporter permease [Dysgonamonadaceae bacterium]MDD4728070.1 ABC transporter permease [Dysgonamonadaceae bacterium]
MSKQFLAFVKKEFYHILRDKRTMLILLGMPVVQILIFGFAINMEVQNIRIAIYEPKADIYTQDIKAKVEANHYFILKATPHSIQEVNELLRKGEIDMALIFPNNFHNNLVHAGKSQIQIIADSSDPNIGTISTNYLRAIIGQQQKEWMNLQQIPYEVNVTSKLHYNPEMKSAYTFVPGIMGLVLMIICAIMTSISIVREKEMGTMEVLLASPLNSTTVLLSKTIPYLALSVINLVTILILSVYVLKVPIVGSLSLLIFVSVLFIFLSLSLGLLISTLVQTQVVAIIISGIGLMMPVLILSGMIFPISNMPVVLQWLSTLVPARWYITAVKKIMIQGLGLVAVVKEITILSGMIVTLVILSIRNIKPRME